MMSEPRLGLGAPERCGVDVCQAFLPDSVGQECPTYLQPIAGLIYAAKSSINPAHRRAARVGDV